MSKEKDNLEVESVLGGKPVNSNAKVEMSVGELEGLISRITEASDRKLEKFAEMLSGALLESRKPYVSDAQKANEETMRKSMKDQRERLMADIRASQDTCPHLQGANALSEKTGDMTSIVQHRLDIGAVIGICTNCQRVFKPGDPDYLTQMRRKSGNKMSSAGIRMFLDPLSVQRAGLSST
jgi:hypothetical protein